MDEMRLRQRLRPAYRVELLSQFILENLFQMSILPDNPSDKVSVDFASVDDQTGD